MLNLDKIHISIINKIHTELKKYLNSQELEYFWSKFGTGEKFLKSITLIPFHVYEYVKKKKNTLLIKKLEDLGYINLKASIAYTVYDYIHDNKFEQVYVSKFLSLANMYTHDFLFKINTLCKDEKFLKCVKTKFNTIDEYYLKPSSTDLTDVYKKSIGLSVVPLCVLHMLGYGEKTQLFKAMDNLFKNYLNARQLSDDFDDLEKDIQTNQYTPAVLLYLKNKNIENVQKALRKQIDLNMKKVKASFHNPPTFDGQKFIDGYIREC